MPIRDCNIADGALIGNPDLVNLYECRIGTETRIGPFVEIQAGCVIGARCKVSSHSFLCSGVVIEDGVFIGHGVVFTNDRFPRSTNEDGSLQRAGDWTCEDTLVRMGASIGSNATILCGLVIGERALVGAGSVVTANVADFAIVAGVPARVVGDVREQSKAAASGKDAPSKKGSMR